MKIKRCTCRLCKYGQRTKCQSELTTLMVRKYRHKVKQLLKKGKWEEAPIYIPLDYTD